MVSIFVSVFVDSYIMASEKMLRDAKGKKEPMPAIPSLDDKPMSAARNFICDVVTQNEFDMFIAFFIVANVVSMAFDTFRPATWQVGQSWLPRTLTQAHSHKSHGT